jgi:hypothetical protein
VTAFDGLGRLTAWTMRLRPDVQGARTDCGHRLHARLVMIGHDLVWYYTGPPDGLLKEGLSTGGVVVLAQQDVDDNTLLIDGSIQVPFLSLTE